MKLGVQYYRDPNPPEVCWPQDLTDIAAAGFSFIGVWIPWRYVNPRPDVWELDATHRLLDLAEERGLGVRLQLVPESAPDWAARENADTLLVNARGQRVPLNPHPMLQLGGWPGLNACHPVARGWIDDYYRQVLTRLKGHPAILAWSVWNEIQVPVASYDAHTQAAYRVWAERRYGDLAAYNAAHHTQYESFAELSLPNPEIEGELLLGRAADLNTFRWEQSVAEGHHRANLVRQSDPDRPVAMHTNSNSPFPGNRDDWDVAAAADFYGNSTYNIDPFYDTLSAIKQRSLKGPGGWWLTEHSSGRFVYYYGHATLSGRQIVGDFLKAMAHGASAAAVWQYRAEYYGQEAPNFGLLDLEGKPSERFAALAGLAGALKKLGEQDLAFDPPAIGMLFEPLDLVFRSASEGWMRQPWQEYSEFEQWLCALLEIGHSPDFVRVSELVNRPLAESFRVLVAPSLVVLRPGVAEALRDWVRRGGHLVVGPFTGVFDPQGWTFPQMPGDGLDALFGVRVTDRISGADWRFFAPGGEERLDGRFLFEQVRVGSGAEVNLDCDGRPAVVTRREGLGSATYLASFTGAARADGSPRLAAWLRHGLAERGVAAPVAFEGPVWINTARRGGEPVVFVHNPAAEPCVVKIESDGRGWHDPVENITWRASEGSANVPLEPRQTRMLLKAED